MAEPRLVGTSSLLLLSSGAERLSGLIVTVLIGRILGPEALGQYSLILTLWSVFAVLAYFGQAKQIARDIARSPDLAPKLLGTSSALSLMASIVAGALMIATSAGLGYPQIVLAGTAIAAASFLWADSQCVVTEAALISLRRVSAVAAINIVASAVRAVVSLAMLLWRIDVLAMLALIGATQIATAIALRAAAARAVRGHALRWDGDVARGYAQGAVLFTLTALANMVFARMDALLIEAMVGVAALGIYSAAFRVAQTAHMLAPPIFRAAAPQFARAKVVSLQAVADLAHARLRSLALLFGLVSIGFVLAGSPIMVRVFGAAFSASSIPLIALAAATLSVTVNGFFTSIALATDLERYVLRINVINGMISLALNLALIPMLGPAGSALAFLTTSIVGMIQGAQLLRREGMLAPRAAAAAVAPAFSWVGLATVTAFAVALAQLSWPVPALAGLVCCGGLTWSYRRTAASILRPVGERWARFRSRS